MLISNLSLCLDTLSKTSPRQRGERVFKRGEASPKIISPSPSRERGIMRVRVIEMGKKSSGFEPRNQCFLKLNGLLLRLFKKEGVF